MLYSGTLLFIHPKHNSLHFANPSLPAHPSPTPSPLEAQVLFICEFVSVV